jgi:hypothetical protein
MRRFAILAVVGVLLLAPVVPTVASTVVTGDPALSYSVADDTFEPSEETRLTVVATNDGNIDDDSSHPSRSRLSEYEPAIETLPFTDSVRRGRHSPECTGASCCFLGQPATGAGCPQGSRE